MEIIFVMFIVASCVISLSDSYIVDPGPTIRATRGEIWPKPKTQQFSDTFYIIRPASFKFNAVNNTCDILTKALERYERLLASLGNVGIHMESKTKFHHGHHNTVDGSNQFRSFRNDRNFEGYLDSVSVNLLASCDDKPHMGMDESYKIDINIQETTSASIQSFSIWGILRGLESFSQLWSGIDGTNSVRINSTFIDDEPRYEHRGLLLDTSRHYINMPKILQILDGMAYTKLNVFHWHIVDDQSFPYQSITYPELSEQGAYHPSAIYTQADVANVIEYARLRGIRVMAEFDTPGHTRSWGVSHPELLTECGGKYAGKLGPIDPTKEEVYTFIENLFSEAVRVFPDRYFHLGGDEVGFECWQSNAHITEFMSHHNLTTYEQLEEMYIQRVVDIMEKLNVTPIVWQEVFLNGVRLSAGTVVHVWTGYAPQLLANITSQQFPAILSTCWYLDHLKTGGDWKSFYNCDPGHFTGTVQQKKLVIGGEACMWSEVVDSGNVIQRIFPRVCAAAERLWSRQDVNDEDEAARRLEEHVCRMKKRGIEAQPPNNSGACF